MAASLLSVGVYSSGSASVPPHSSADSKSRRYYIILCLLWVYNGEIKSLLEGRKSDQVCPHPAFIQPHHYSTILGVKVSSFPIDHPSRACQALTKGN